MNEKGDPAVDIAAVDCKSAHAKRVKERRRLIRDYRRRQSAVEAIAEFGPETDIHGLTLGQFSLIDLIRAVLDVTGPAHLTVSTWTAAKFDADQIHELLQSGMIRSTRWLVDFSFQRRAPGIAHQIRKLFGHDAIRVARNHAKLVLVRNRDWSIVLETSMNLNTNPRLENFTLANDHELANFYQDVFDAIWRKQPRKLAFQDAGEILQTLDRTNL